MLEDPFSYMDRKQERCYWRRVGFGLFFAIAAALLLIPMLSGCATTGTEQPEQRVCYVQFLGKTENGWTVIAQQCVTPEAFAAAQK
jgi:hypothetical protein